MPRWGAAEALLKLAGCALMAAGVGLGFDAVVNRDYAPPPAPEGDVAEARGRAARTAPLRRSPPVSVEIPAIGVRAPVEPVGVGLDGTLAVPSTSRPHVTGWYERGPSPGERGPAVLVGHVDAVGSGPAVFYRLGELRRGDRVRIRREDGSVARFTVRGVRAFAKADFPAGRVYGPTAAPELRLITCGGRYDAGKGEYLDNIIAFADYVPPGKAGRRAGGSRG
ncbi:hypothetical protein HNP84_003893 [Thermocatellispora tengchongensis]|uniref:Class F sortase n=1 Tax=Thermocatellispora tengchongensis TaxID=1073253 RepID=A0A840PAE3_9ACTN|nr:class F sortase [Thermocatellispora tengchongensis]MBB5134167.1 hypothetical protein [Thermocatellispora tengchongensis]